MKKLYLDFETYSPTPITHGTHRYAEQAEILLWAWAIDDEPAQVWDCANDPVAPPRLVAAVNDPAVEVWAHNSGFDRTVMRHALGDFCPPVERWRDIMVQALAHGLPGSLGTLCEVLGVPSDKAKDKAGKQLIQLFCKPTPFRFPYKRADFASKAEYDAAKLAASENWAGRATRATHPEQWEQFKAYAGGDVEAMREVHKRLPTWNFKGKELALWHLDQRINDRGVYIDLALAQGALDAVDEEQEVLAARTSELTEGAVETATRVDKLLLHILEAYGVDLPDMQKSTLERRISDPDLPDGLKDLLRVRLSTATTSTSKYKTLINGTSSDGRLRGLLQFCGASRTGRWAGRLFQPQNLPSRGLLKQHQIEMGIEALKAGTANLIFDDVMKLTSSAIRGCIAAPAGGKLVVADLSNIEGRDQAWLAGESWKLKAFADFDTVQAADGRWLTGPEYFDLCRQNRAPQLALDGKGEPIRRGHDLYKMSYGKSFNVAPQDVTKDQRQVGKVQELALGYEGGVGAFVTFAAGYGIDLDELASKAQAFIPGDVWGQANIMLQWHRDHGRDPAAQLGMADRTWLVCESFKLGWRSGHANIKAYWKELDACVREAISVPGTTIPCGKVKIRRDGAWLRVVLPSGRALCYPGPKLEAEKRKRKDEAETADIFSVQDDTEVETGRTKITYMGVNPYSRKWGRIDTYGGKLFENCLTADTEVLTMAGWRRIDAVGDLPVWDGHEWVEHDGCIYKGKEVVLKNYGVRMTPDHLVLTEKGWKNASSCEGLNRADVGLPDSYQVHRIGERAPVYVGGEVRLRETQTDAGFGVPQATEARHSGIVRVHAQSYDRAAQHRPWDERAPGVLGLAQHVRPVPPADAPGIPQLWRTGYRGLREVARIVRSILVGHGADLLDGEVDRAARQRVGLWAGQLPVAVTAAPSEQQTYIADDRHAPGADIGSDGGTSVGHLRRDAVLPAGPWVAGFEGVEPVYDLMNCGPRHQFVVRGADGHALIVHNCCQAVARDVMAENMPLIEAAGYEIVLSVHDELVCEAPDRPEFNPEHLAALLCAPPPWAPDMPLAAAGFEATRYRKD